MITVSVVTYHTPHRMLRRLLDSIFREGVEKVWIVDHGDDLSLEALAKSYYNCEVIHTTNDGYGSGHNVALRKCMENGSDFHLVVNPDVYWTDDVIKEMERYMKVHPECGLLMPKVLYPHGEIQRLCKLLPTPADLFLRRFMPIRSWREKSDRRYELHDYRYDIPMQIPSLSGCFMFIRVEILGKIGIFDERYFMYGEDIDLCRRIGEKSATVCYPLVAIYHEYAKESYHNRKLLKYHMLSMVKYFNKWGWWFDNYRKNFNSECISNIKRQLHES